MADAARGFAAHLTTALEAGVPFFEAGAIRETIARIPHAPEREGREAIGNHGMILVFDPGKLGSLKEFPATPAPSATRR